MQEIDRKRPGCSHSLGVLLTWGAKPLTHGPLGSNLDTNYSSVEGSVVCDCLHTFICVLKKCFRATVAGDSYNFLSSSMSSMILEGEF